MSRRVLLLTNNRTGSTAAQELPIDLPVEFVTLFASTMNVPLDTVWQVVEIPDEINGRDTTRFAEQSVL